MPQVFFSPAARHSSNVIDVICQTGRGLYTDKTREQLELEHGPLEIIDDSEAVTRIEQARTTEPQEITKEQFWYWLECLPPCRWSRRGGAEVFHVSERITYSIVTWCVRIGERYFSLNASDRLNGSEVIDRVSRKFFPIEGAADQAGSNK